MFPLTSFSLPLKAGKGGELTHDEATIISGALDLTEKVATVGLEKGILIVLSLAISICNKVFDSCHFLKDSLHQNI